MALIPRITKSDNSIVKQMYKDWYVLRAVTHEFMYWDKKEQIAHDEEQQDKKELYEKMKELKRDPVKYKALEQEAFEMLTPAQKKSDAMFFHRDKILRELILNI